MSASLRIYPILALAVGGAAIAVAGAWLYKRRKTPEQRERERRMRISQSGRITDGTVIDVAEMKLKEADLQLLIFQYDVAGVSYETSQDITGLQHLVDVHNCRVGLPASIKYDPANPGNSIVVAEDWSGLRM